MRIFLSLLLLTAASAFAGEYAVLASGARLHADRHASEGGKVRLYTGAGYIELAAEQISSFEPEGTPAKPPGKLPAKPAEGPAAVSAVPSPSATELADAAADKYGLPRRLVRSVMLAESAGQPQAVSPKGAIGLMQLMPSTARLLGANPHDPAQNVEAGVRYLRDLLIRFDGRLWHALAAYNAGPGALDKYSGNIPPYQETLRYIQRIDRSYNSGTK